MPRKPASNELAPSPKQFFTYPIWIRQNLPF
jgi:hypothetical protein